MLGLKTMALNQILWAEKNLKGKTGKEKKEAVIKRIDDLIVLPSYLEWVDDIVIGILVDSICKKLNEFIGHDFGTEKLSEIEQEKIIDDIKINENEN